MTKFDPQNRMEQLGKERRIDNKNGLVPIMEQDIKLAITRKYAGVLLLRLHNSGYGLPGVYQEENSSMGWVWPRYAGQYGRLETGFVLTTNLLRAPWR